jgi:hypothetical protein
MPKVFISKRDGLDYSDALRFGDLVYLTDSNRRDLLDANYVARMCSHSMVDAEHGDFIVLGAVSLVNSIASGIFASRFGRLNLLTWNPNSRRYEPRYVVTDQPTRKTEDLDAVS